MSFSPGSRFGRYRVVRELGRGGDAIVHLADDEVLKRPVALKVFPVTVAVEGSAGEKRFRTEIEVLARLDHPGICRIHDAGIEEGLPYIAMSYVEGVTLDLAPRPAPAGAIGIVEDVARTIAAAHSAGVVHGDLKPQNILVAKSGSCVVLDFGISCFLGDRKGTGPGRNAGTIAYLAPERLAGPPQAASDVYALGAVLFELVTGRTPFVAPTHAAFVKTLSLEDPPLLRSIAPDLPADLEAVLARSLHRDAGRRYESMAAFADDLARLRRGEPVSAARFGPIRRTQRWARRRPALAALAGVVIAFLATLVSIAVVKNRALARYFERTRTEAGRSADEARAAEGHLLRYARLADGRRVADLEARARKLVPAAPALLPDFEAWMASARDVVHRLPEHRSVLEVLRASGRRSPGGRFASDVSGAAAREIEALTRRRARIAETERSGTAEASRNAAALGRALDAHLRVLQSKSPKLEAWTFDASADAWREASLSALVEDLERFAGDDPRLGTMQDVERRIAEARRHAVDEDATRASWDEAIRAIADREASPRYGGLRIRPQFGLVPLGPNPVTGLWEFLHATSGTRPDPSEDRPTPERGIVLVLLPGGLARMGALRPDAGGPREGPHIDPDAEPAEGPPDDVRLDPFFISKYEATEAQWVRLTRGSQGPDSRRSIWSPDETTPVYAIDWYDATRVLARIGLVLPTEAQWEYAARAGTTTPWWTGTLPETLAGAELFAKKDAARVGSYRPNGFGLYDVAGNLAEWCADLFCPYHCPRLPGTGERSGFDLLDQRVCRGGMFNLDRTFCRSAWRAAAPPAARLRNTGVRPARLLER